MAIDYAKKFGAKVVLIHAYDGRGALTSLPMAGVNTIPDGFLEDIVNAAKARVDEAAREVSEGGVWVSSTPAEPDELSTGERQGLTEEAERVGQALHEAGYSIIYENTTVQAHSCSVLFRKNLDETKVNTTGQIPVKPDAEYGTKA